jgi:hypothetical protein
MAISKIKSNLKTNQKFQLITNSEIQILLEIAIAISIAIDIVIDIVKHELFHLPLINLRVEV